jgi:hypothetical protein
MVTMPRMWIKSHILRCKMNTAQVVNFKLCVLNFKISKHTNIYIYEKIYSKISQMKACSHI